MIKGINIGLVLTSLAWLVMIACLWHSPKELRHWAIKFLSRADSIDAMHRAAAESVEYWSVQIEKEKQVDWLVENASSR